MVDQMVTIEYFRKLVKPEHLDTQIHVRHKLVINVEYFF